MKMRFCWAVWAELGASGPRDFVLRVLCMILSLRKFVYRKLVGHYMHERTAPARV